MKKRKDELSKQDQKHLTLNKNEFTFVGAVLLPSIVIPLINLIFKLIVRPLGSGSISFILIESAIFFVFIFVIALIVFFVMKRKIKKLDNAPKANSFLPGKEFEIEKFSPIDMRTPDQYPIHLDFMPAVKSFRALRFFLFFSTSALTLIVFSSFLLAMSQNNSLMFLCILAFMLPPLFYIKVVIDRLESSLQENSFHLAHADIYETDLLALSRDFSRQHMMYKLTIRLGNTLKDFHVRPLPTCDKNFAELGLKDENFPVKISVFISPVTGEPIALATQKAPIWLADANMPAVQFLPPRKGARILTLARPYSPLEFEKGIKFLADKSSKHAKTDKFDGTWQGIKCFDQNPLNHYNFYLNLNQNPTGEISGTYHSKVFGLLYGKVLITGKSLDNEIYLNVVYHSLLWNWFQKPEFFAGIYDQKKRQITGTFKKGSLTGIFVLAKD